jgi:hypothetical protein
MTGTCKGFNITEAHFSSSVTIPAGYALLSKVWVRSYAWIDPVSFQASSLYLDESSRLSFTGTVPNVENIDLHVTYNLANLGRRTGSDMVRDGHNPSVFKDFDRSAPAPIRHICGHSFPKDACEAWSKKIRDNCDILGNDFGSGVSATPSFDRKDDDSGGSYLTYETSGGSTTPVVTPRWECLFVTLTYSGGDPKGPHYEEPPGESNSEDDSGLSSGTAPAIALGVILAIVIVAVVVLIVLGKLVFSRGADVEP